MKIITLTTDMGLKDHYVASLKGKILQSIQDIQIIDISHSIKPFDIADAAYQIKNSFKDFPKGTIHVIGVDSEPVINFSGADGSFPSILLFNDQYFISNDNGFFGAFLGENKPDEFWIMDAILNAENPFQFPAKNLLIPIATKILSGESLDSFAKKSDYYKNALTMTAITETNLIKGHVINIDSYGNIITNISRDLFEQIGKESQFILYFKNKNYYIDFISNSYNEVAQGEKVAIFNEGNLLEIAINRGANRSTGGAEQLFGLRVQDIVRVEFTPKGSRDTIDSLF